MIEPCSNCGAKDCYGDCYDDTAKAMSAGTAETQSGSGRQPASAVGVADLPDSTPETPQVQP